VHASEQDRPWIVRRRAQWRKYQGRLDPRRLVFIDETWAKTNMTRTHGRCARGRRLNAKVPHGRWRTLTFIAALRHDRIDAPCVLDGPINGISFLAWVEQFLVPTLSRRRQAPVPAALQPGPQPDRAGLRQAQDPPPQSRRTHHRGRLAAHRIPPRRLLTNRMRKLHHKQRIRFMLRRSRSSLS
jgi:hypothetical protein